MTSEWKPAEDRDPTCSQLYLHLSIAPQEEDMGLNDQLSVLKV
jgi:hypothetical protein